MSLTLYYAPMSTSGITELVIAELGIPVEKIKLDIRAGETRKPEYLKINPNGAVPCIVHDGVAIWESAAITIYLGEQFGTAKNLWPAAGPHRGEAMKWVVWANVTVVEAMGRRMRSAGKDEAAHAEANADIAELMGMLDAQLAGKQAVLGDYTLVDTHLSSLVHWMLMTKVDFSKFANITAWLARGAERPAVKKMMSGG